MKRTLLPALLIALAAAGSATAATSADKSVARHLDKLGYTYEVDEDGDYRMVFDVEGRSPVSIDMPTMWAHSITNTGDSTLHTVFWTDDIFDPRNPDTFPESVTP